MWFVVFGSSAARAFGRLDPQDEASRRDRPLHAAGEIGRRAHTKGQALLAFRRHTFSSHKKLTLLGLRT